MKKIADIVGFPLGKKKSNQSPKAGAKNRGAAKASAAKKKTGQTAAMEMSSYINLKSFSISEQIPEPVFRYVPDRGIIQRLLTRASNMKDDLAEFDLF